jgi:hypothetical protein
MWAALKLVLFNFLIESYRKINFIFARKGF